MLMRVGQFRCLLFATNTVSITVTNYNYSDFHKGIEANSKNRLTKESTKTAYDRSNRINTIIDLPCQCRLISWFSFGPPILLHAARVKENMFRVENARVLTISFWIFILFHNDFFPVCVGISTFRNFRRRGRGGSVGVVRVCCVTDGGGGGGGLRIGCGCCCFVI